MPSQCWILVITGNVNRHARRETSLYEQHSICSAHIDNHVLQNHGNAEQMHEWQRSVAMKNTPRIALRYSYTRYAILTHHSSLSSCKLRMICSDDRDLV